MKTYLKTLLEENHRLNDAMEQAILEIVKNNGGLIRTDNTTERSTIYAFVVDSYMGDVIEKKVLAVTSFEGNLSILIAWSDNETLEGMSDDEVENVDDWYNVRGGYVTANATLYNLCDGILDYVKQ